MICNVIMACNCGFDERKSNNVNNNNGRYVKFTHKNKSETKQKQNCQ